MKTSLTYGFLMAIGGALVTLALYFAGLHDSAAKLDMAQWIAGCLGLAVGSACLYFALRDSREAATGAGNDWLFGSAFGAGVATAAVSAVFTAVFSYVYFAYINPDFGSFVTQAQVAKMEENGAPSAQIEAATKFMERLNSAPVLTIVSAVGGVIFGMIVTAHLGVAMTRRHRRAVLYRIYGIFGLVLGFFVGFSQGAAHHHALLGLGLGIVLGPLVEVAVAALFLSIAKYQPSTPRELAAIEADAPPPLA